MACHVASARRHVLTARSQLTSDWSIHGRLRIVAQPDAQVVDQMRLARRIDLCTERHLSEGGTAMDQGLAEHSSGSSHPTRNSMAPLVIGVAVI